MQKIIAYSYATYLLWGILFLDELPEFQSSVLETLREPLEEKQIRLMRMEMNYTYPADFLFLAAMNLKLMQAPKIVAIVGARNCTPYGRQMAYDFARTLAAHGVVIVSGMAMGIDSAAHEGALCEGGNTIAVLGNGADICYPKICRNLYEQIKQEALVISEYPPGTTPLPGYFPMRNRLISGLSDLTLIIEAREKSGSLITADFALEQGKEVFALPGRITDTLSRGCNRLIKQGAGIATEVEDILQILEILPDFTAYDLKKTKIRLAKEEKMVYSCIDFEPKDMNVILEQVPLPAAKIMQILVNLELQGLIEEQMPGQYSRNRR